jgi:hypothetical protein
LAEFIEASGAFTRNGEKFDNERRIPHYDNEPEPRTEIEEEWASDDEDGEG